MIDELNRAERHLLKKCCSGKGVAVQADGSLRAGGATWPAGAADRLLKRALVAHREERLVASPEGAAWVRRALAARADPAGKNGSTYAAQHRIVSRAAASGPARNRAESPLTALAARKGKDGRPLIGARQLEAGLRLAEDFHEAGIMPALVRDYQQTVRRAGRAGPVGLMPADVRIEAKRRYDRAIAALGPQLSDIAVRVCCWNEGLGPAESALGWPVRSGKLVLAIALDRLADHYDGRRPASA